ncbi:hypothetical protein CGZ75_12190 [Paenibacillus herberti]|uniref:Uncharacterized protein n=1 Tax=Paenibacillus herberti TaxID=1619309 RepID=A0A229P4W7_9BACL|nr:hypothetical protein CGZ75_12190 [Paenibacillus herberti]
MKRTIRLQYSRADREATGLMIDCCRNRHLIIDLYGDPGAAYCCRSCGRPLACMGIDGKLYRVGDPVIEGRRDKDGNKQQ